MKHNPYWK